MEPLRNPFAIGDCRIARVQAMTACDHGLREDAALSLRDFVAYRPCLDSTCGRCAPLVVAFEAAATYLARPEQSAVVTWSTEFCGPYDGLQLHQIAKIIRPRLDEIATSLRLRYTSSSFLARIELSADDGRPHAHLLHRGNHVRADRFYDACIDARLGVGKIQMIDNRLAMVGYVFKTGLWSLLLLPEDAQTVLEFDRDLNGGSYYHATTGFLSSNLDRSWHHKTDDIVLRLIAWIERTNQRESLWKMMPSRLLDLVPLERRGEYDS